MFSARQINVGLIGWLSVGQCIKLSTDQIVIDVVNNSLSINKFDVTGMLQQLFNGYCTYCLTCNKLGHAQVARHN